MAKVLQSMIPIVDHSVSVFERASFHSYGYGGEFWKLLAGRGKDGSTVFDRADGGSGC